MFEFPKVRRASLVAASCVVLAACDLAEQNEKTEPMTSPEQQSETASSDDPYLWLEEVEGTKAIEWVKAQNERTLSELQADSRYEKLLAEATAILTSDDRIPGASLRGGYAYNFWQDEANERGLWRRMPIADYLALKDEWETLLDFDALAEQENENWVYKGSSCLAPENTRCILTLSRGGSDAAVRREYDIETGAFVENGFNLSEAKAGTAWIDENTMLVGMDLGEGTMTASGYPRTVRHWIRGEAIEDAKMIFEGETEDVGIFPFSEITSNGTLVGIVRALTFFESETYILNSKGEYEKLPLPRKSSVSGITSGQMIITLRQDWTYQEQTFPSGSMIAMNPDDYSATLIFAPQERVAIESVWTSNNAVYAELLDNIVGKVQKFTLNGAAWESSTIALPDAGVVSISSVDGQSGDLLAYFENPTTPESQYFVANDTLTPQKLRTTPSFFEADEMVTTQYQAESSDGTLIPYFVTAKKAVLESGPAPTIQYGYGGFQISILPNYSGTVGKLWLENNGVYVTANIRGGGEFGPSWHQAALKENRQLAFDDFYAVSEDLIRRGITTPEQLGILGGSNGGLLMGVAMTQRPDLYNAIGIGVPLLDMLRYHKLLAGASWVGEYGDPDIPEERAYIERYSPYQNLNQGEEYPRVYFFTSTKDDRVHPGHARKMAALMEQYEMPFLYYENIEGGHAASSNQTQLAKRLALQYVYYSRQLADNN